MRLTIKAIIRWELLNNKPFSLLDYSNEDEVISLFYTCKQSDWIEISLNEFKDQLKEEDLKQMVGDFEKQIRLVSQFQHADKDTGSDKEKSDPVYIKDVVPLLVMNGLDVYYAMSDMQLCDLPVFLKAYDLKLRDKLLRGRLWASIQVSPHVGKSIKPEDICPFPWEMEEKPVSTSEIEESKNEFKAFFENGLNI